MWGNTKFGCDNKLNFEMLFEFKFEKLKIQYTTHYFNE